MRSIIALGTDPTTASWDPASAPQFPFHGAQRPWRHTRSRVMVSRTTEGIIVPKPIAPSGVIADAVHLACRAPSFHNSQPWRFVGKGAGVLHLFLDRDRLVETDASGRQALISCGAVLDHLKVAMAAAGWVAKVDYYPNPNDSTHLASIEFVPMGYVTRGHRRRADAILARRTDRLPFAPERWDDFEPLLLEAVDDDLAHLAVLSEDSRGRLAEASALTEALRLYDSPRTTPSWPGGLDHSPRTTEFPTARWCRRPKAIASTSAASSRSPITANGGTGGRRPFKGARSVRARGHEFVVVDLGVLQLLGHARASSRSCLERAHLLDLLHLLEEVLERELPFEQLWPRPARPRPCRRPPRPSR